MISTIVRNGFLALRRDRGALVLCFVVPVAFFSIFATIFGSMSGNSTPRLDVLVVDEDHSAASESLVRGLRREHALRAATRPEAKSGEPQPPDYTAASAETAVRKGDTPAALIIPAGFGANPISLTPAPGRKPIRLLHDSSNPVAAQMVAGLLQKVAMTSLSTSMAELGTRYLALATGGLTPQQREKLDANLARMHDLDARRDAQSDTAATAKGDNSGGMVAVEIRDVVGENKKNSMISYYAAAIGVMFLMFTASGAAGALLDESESGALDRILSARVSMTTLLTGKLTYLMLLACSQLTLMFLWGAAVFHLDLFTHLPGFFVMTVATAFPAAAFGLLLASVSHTRAQQASISTLLILSLSAIGGSMFPRYIMPATMQKLGLLTFNAWAIDGYTKVFWRDEPLSHLAPQVAVLLGFGALLFLIARHFAHRWESA
jgi:ABC-2 type transport system permease protein